MPFNFHKPPLLACNKKPFKTCKFEIYNLTDKPEWGLRCLASQSKKWADIAPVSSFTTTLDLLKKILLKDYKCTWSASRINVIYCLLCAFQYSRHMGAIHEWKTSCLASHQFWILDRLKFMCHLRYRVCFFASRACKLASLTEKKNYSYHFKIKAFNTTFLRYLPSKG